MLNVIGIAGSSCNLKTAGNHLPAACLRLISVFAVSAAVIVLILVFVVCFVLAVSGTVLALVLAVTVVRFVVHFIFLVVHIVVVFRHIIPPKLFAAAGRFIDYSLSMASIPETIRRILFLIFISMSNFLSFRIKL